MIVLKHGRTVREQQLAELCREAEVFGISEPGHRLPQLLYLLSIIVQ